MKQPVSRTSFDRLRGYLGVYLQEGAPFVDAPWNESSDIHAALLREAVEDAGLEGAAGDELRIDPIPDEEGQALRNLVIRGGEGRFYCGGLPVRWPESRSIDAQDIFQGPLARPWLEGRDGDASYTIYLEAWLEAVDALDRPDLDDPGLGAERGSFRTRVGARVRVSEAMPRHERSNVRLTVHGSYVSSSNVLYHVELLDLVTGPDDKPAASLLWDTAAASVAARVTERAEANATKVTLSTTEGFSRDSYVRFEGPGVDATVYRVIARDAATITIEGHACGAPDVSMADCADLRFVDQGNRWEVEVEDDGEGSLRAAIPPGSRVKDLPRNLKTPVGASQWRVIRAERGSRHDRSTFLLEQNGLVAALEPWAEEHASELVLPAHPFHTCIEVEEHPAWVEGMRLRIHAAVKSGAQRRSELEWTHTEAGPDCKPGGETVTSYEDRTVARIIRHPRPHHHHPDGEEAERRADRLHPSGGSPHHAHRPTMTLRLDRPLSFEHAAGDVVVPERLIRARRYEGHACSVHIDTVDPAFQPTRKHPEGPYSLGGSFVLPTGLSLRLSVVAPEEPKVVRGDGWTFAARAGGWVEAPVFAPAQNVPRGFAPLAELRLLGEGGYELIDIRPVPAPRAHHGWLAIIADAADEIAAQLPDTGASAIAQQIAKLARYPRAQRRLVDSIVALTDQPEDLNRSRACERALNALREAASIDHPESPKDTALSRISSAMERLSLALAVAMSCGGDGDGDGEGGGWYALQGSRQRRGAKAAPPAEPPARAAQIDKAEPALSGAADVKEPDVPAAEAGQLTLPEPAQPTSPPERATSQAPEVPAKSEAADARPADEPAPASQPARELDIMTLPTRHVRTTTSEQRRRWPTLGDVPTPSSVPRERDRRLAETVATLLDQTAAIGARVAAEDADRDALQTALDALWKPRFEVNRLSQPIRVDDAVALFQSRSRHAQDRS
jgi:hypothetical protein